MRLGSAKPAAAERMVISASAPSAPAVGSQGSGFRVQVSGCRVQGSGFRVQGSGFRRMVMSASAPNAPAVPIVKDHSVP